MSTILQRRRSAIILQVCWSESSLFNREKPLLVEQNLTLSRAIKNLSKIKRSNVTFTHCA